MSTPAKPEPARPATTLTEVKYSLPEILEELKTERTSGSFGMDRLDQHEIGKLFKAKKTRRAKSKH